MRAILLICFLIVTTAVSAQFHINNFNDGYYYTNSGQKVKGRIEKYAEVYSDSLDHKHILFKTDSGKKEVNFADIRSFVIGNDSFTVSHAKLIAYKVLLNTPVKLYSYLTISNIYAPGFVGANGMMTGGGNAQSKITNYFYGSSPDSVVAIKHKNFIDAMSKIVGDKPNVFAKVKDKTYTMGWIDEIIAFYITGKEHQKAALFKGKN